MYENLFSQMSEHLYKDKTSPQHKFKIGDEVYSLRNKTGISYFIYDFMDDHCYTVITNTPDPHLFSYISEDILVLKEEAVNKMHKFKVGDIVESIKNKNFLYEIIGLRDNNRYDVKVVNDVYVTTYVDENILFLKEKVSEVITEEFKLEEGKYYLDREGNKKGPMKKNDDDTYSWIDEGGDIFTSRGFFWYDEEETEYDLVSEYVEIEEITTTQETKNEIKIGQKWIDKAQEYYIVTVVHVSEGTCTSVFYVHDDGSGTAEYIENFTTEWKPFIEKQTINGFVVVFKDENKVLRFADFADTLERAKDIFRNWYPNEEYVDVVEVSYTEK